ncbi:MAG: glutathione S-transferase family protein [Novosphingobium sp.]|nr:glutathione S-transferase family protein [Novosphingobium sp.]
MTQASQIEITAFDWVPPMARGHVRDLRPRWACEEMGLPYQTRLISAMNRPQWYYAEQPWGQVPFLRDGEVTVFESGATLLHLAEKTGKLMPQSGQGRADVQSWLLAAFNSVEPWYLQLLMIVFAGDEEWARLRKPAMLEFMAQRLGRLADAMGDREWLAGEFSIADIAMATVLRDTSGPDMVPLDRWPNLAAYLDRALARPAFQRALDAQFADFKTDAEAGV